ncbi:hypothetical protein TGME49_282170 [Toxoplasma gondii ME49]|uniref:CRAL/TRIO domain protein n=2 Tax=Toxoplasma gondii TaxID=5811 RepID=S8GEX7_TOXGM|nr:hypothetical protein TGME49_282170 [Toxoplasma gondii ME49]EPT30375.1 hypothetical protein TGME49_282170 [Toxoplasma gondii ME49]KYF43955.1 hypothetical protein TGARI_282170 [Toxoplasma gondii ARI]|eukprot:XP_018637470.1 hypothetical protein TGME49_282170 [Toxoplasma gondii ME49]
MDDKAPRKARRGMLPLAGYASSPALSHLHSIEHSSAGRTGCSWFTRCLTAWRAKRQMVFLACCAVISCLSPLRLMSDLSQFPWSVLQVAAAPLEREVAAPAARGGGASQGASKAHPVLRFSEADLRQVDDGFERHQNLYPTFLHGRSKQKSLVIYRTISTAATSEPYIVQRDLLIDGFLLQQAILQGGSSPRFLLVIDLAPISSFIKASLGPAAVATLHKEPGSPLLGFVNSAHWQRLRSLFFVPSRCEGVVLLNAPAIVLQLLSVFDHFLFHPNRNMGTGRGNPSSAHAIEAALASNKGGRFLLQGSLDTSALCDFVDPAEIPAEYAYACTAGAEEAESGKSKLGEAPETHVFFQSLFSLAKRLHGNLEKAKRRNPTLFDLSLKASAAGIKTALSFGPALLGDDPSESTSSADSKDVAKTRGAREKELKLPRSKTRGVSSKARAPARGVPAEPSRGETSAHAGGAKRRKRSSQIGPEASEAEAASGRDGVAEHAAPSVPAQESGDSEEFAVQVESPFFAPSGPESVPAEAAWGVDPTRGAWGEVEPTAQVALTRGFFVNEEEAQAVGSAFDDVD